uniref:CHHC U11-48K-type domain-containing protein n=1 Tax=Ciona savignyi TaxID=51511 RepID=H2Z0X7_CIOSA
MDFNSPYQVEVNTQSMQQWDKDEMFICPYDPVHRISAKRFVRHIQKCKKNHPGANMGTCPFNARHIVPKPELELHISTCPDKRMMEMEMNYDGYMVSQRPNDISMLPPTTYEELNFGAEEDWDEEARNNTQRLPMVRGRRPMKTTEMNPFISVYEAEAQHNQIENVEKESPPPTVLQRRPILMQNSNNCNKVSVIDIQAKSKKQVFKKTPLLAANFSKPVQANGQPNVDQPTSTPDKESLIREKRKLVKLIYQIEILEVQKSSGVVLNPDQVEKLSRKLEIQNKLADVEKLLEGFK